MARATLAAVLGAALAILLLAMPGYAQDQPEQGLRGRLVTSGEGVAGVTVRVADADGDTVAETTTDDEGNWSVGVPESGTYTISLDTGTLPDDVALRDPEVSPKEVTVAEGQSRAVLFPLVTGAEAAGTGSVQRFLNLVMQGIKLGAIIAMTSIGLSLIFGITGLINFAHGELVTIGAVVAFAFHVGPGGQRLPLVLAALVAVVVGGAVGATLELGLFQPLRRRRTGIIILLVISIGLSFFVRHLIQIFFGVRPRRYIDYAVQRNPIEIGPLALPPRDWAVILISLAVLVTVGLLLQRTKLGTAMRAVADNRDLAESSGIDVNRVTLAVWVFGSALAALGGVFQGLTTKVITFDMGFALLVLMFAGVILGGIGTAFGAMIGGLLVGITSEVSTFWFSVELKLVFAFLVLVLVLILRPQGIMGRRERVG